jgi:cyclopropane fatty-acyl-phospholipid synthase-like methyltransferase
VIAERWPNAEIVSVGISERQVSYCREHAAGSRRSFQRMDATQLAFPPQSFDLVVSVEAAFHFNPRSQFFAEARRVLRDGGMLVLSDILVESAAWPGSASVPAPNFGTDPRRYAAALEAAGFSGVQVTDATAPCWDAYIDRLLEFLEPRARSGEDAGQWLELTHALKHGERAGYVLASGRAR